MSTKLFARDYLLLIDAMRTKHAEDKEKYEKVIRQLQDEMSEQEYRYLSVEDFLFRFIEEQLGKDVLIKVAEQLDEMREQKYGEKNYGYVETVELETYKDDSSTV